VARAAGVRYARRMCGRISLGSSSVADVAAFFGARVEPEHVPLYRPRYNVAPTQRHWIVQRELGERRLVPATWGFPSTTGRLLVNGRIESARSRPAFREAFARRRCIVPADGFYEWTGPARDRRPLRFTPAGGGLLALAGVYEPPEEEGRHPRFGVLSTAANEDVARIHDRMPVVLSPDEIDPWLAGELTPGPIPAGTLVAAPVSRRVNSVENDDPSLLQPEPDQLRLL